MGWIRQFLIALGLVVVSFSVFAGGPVDINTADAEQLAQGITGVGPSKAQAIVQYRSEW